MQYAACEEAADYAKRVPVSCFLSSQADLTALKAESFHHLFAFRFSILLQTVSWDALQCWFLIVAIKSWRQHLLLLVAEAMQHMPAMERGLCPDVCVAAMWSSQNWSCIANTDQKDFCVF